GVEHALNRVRGAGDVGPAPDVCECWSDQNQQERDDADDDEQFDQRKSAGALTLLRQAQCSVGALTLQRSVITWTRLRAVRVYANTAGDAGGEHRGTQHSENQAHGTWQETQRFRTDFR